VRSRLYGITDPHGIDYTYDYDVTYARTAWENAFFAALAALATPAPAHGIPGGAQQPGGRGRRRPQPRRRRRGRLPAPVLAGACKANVRVEASRNEWTVLPKPRRESAGTLRYATFDRIGPGTKRAQP
jgi:hypothetical protein